MAFRTENRHSMRFRMRRKLRRMRDSLDSLIESLFFDRGSPVY